MGFKFEIVVTMYHSDHNGKNTRHASEWNFKNRAVSPLSDTASTVRSPDGDIGGIPAGQDVLILQPAVPEQVQYRAALVGPVGDAVVLGADHVPAVGVLKRRELDGAERRDVGARRPLVALRTGDRSTHISRLHEH